MPQVKRGRFIKGFTVIEILIVCFIIAILSLIVVSGFSLIARNQSVQSDDGLVLSILTQARSQTLSSQNASQYGVHFASSTVTLFTGSSYNASDPNNQVNYLNNSDILNYVSLTGGGTDIVFNRLTGETAQDGTLTLSSLTASSTKIITVYKTGLAQSN